MRKPIRTLPCLLKVSGTIERPTVSINQFEEHRIQEVILGVFKKFDCSIIDMEALIYFVLQEFTVKPHTYEHMYKQVKEHILHNFNIEQGSFTRLNEFNMRRLFVCHLKKD